MKKTLSPLLFCLIHLFIFHGCLPARQSYLTSQYAYNACEMSLLRDIKDNYLNMPFDRACLIASGVHSDKKIQAYQKKIDLLISRITKETSVNNIDNPVEKAKTIF